MTISNFEEAIGFKSQKSEQERKALRQQIVEYIALKLIANGQPVPEQLRSRASLGAERILGTYHQRLKRLDAVRCPADDRIEAFLRRYFPGVSGSGAELKLPDTTLVLDRHGIARELSLPVNGEQYSNDLVSSYRVHNGVLHNPRHDRRTTKGTFHVCEGGLPVPQDKKSVPRQTFAMLFREAMNPPAESLELPFTDQEP